MMQKTSIEWTDYSSNPIYVIDKQTGKRGWHCVKVSPGCAHCYAERINMGRFGTGLAYQQKNNDRVEWVLSEKELDAILRLRKPSKIFLGDMSDLFHADIPLEFIQRVFSVMACCPQHTFQVLTKRSERLRELASALRWSPNVWMGVSVENQDYTFRIDHLRETGARIKFLSLEPLLGPLPNLNLSGMDWVIVGGECLDGDTLVSTTRGTVRIKDIRPDDVVYSFAGKIETVGDGYMLAQKLEPQLMRSRIKHLVVSGYKEIYELRTNCRSILASESHKFLKVSHTERKYDQVHRFMYGLEWRSLSELHEGDVIVVSNSIAEEGQPLELDYPVPYTTPDFMRIVGCFIGDGWVRLRGSRGWIDFALPKASPKREKYVRLIESVFRKKVSEQDTRGIQIHLYDAMAARLFDALELNKKALEKRVPDWVWRLPVDQKLALLEGYIDSDGYIDGSFWRFESPNRALIEDLWGLCLDVGYHVGSINTRTRNRGKWIVNGKEYQYESSLIHYFRSNPRWDGYRGFYGVGYKPMLKSLLNTHFSLDRVRSIKYAGMRETYDLQVEGTHNFVANGIVVHNSGPGARPMREEWVIPIRDISEAAGVPFFFKQWGGRNKKRTGRLLQGGTYDNLPRSLIGA